MVEDGPILEDEGDEGEAHVGIRRSVPQAEVGREEAGGGEGRWCVRGRVKNITNILALDINYIIIYLVL